MQDLTAIENKIRTLLKLALDQQLYLWESERLPQRCRHNHRQPLDYRRTIYGEPNETYNKITVGGSAVQQTIGLCMLNSQDPSEWEGTLCEDPEDAASCPYFTPRTTKAEVYAQFITNAQDPEWVSKHLPTLAALLWVVGVGLDVRAEPTPPLPKSTPPLSLWSRVWLALTYNPPKESLKLPPSSQIVEEAADVVVYLPVPP